MICIVSINFQCTAIIFLPDLKAMIESWNFLNSKLWGLVRCRKKRISALEIGIWDEPWKFPMHLCSAIFTPSNLSYLSALTRRCRLFTSTRESKEGVMKTTKSSLWLAHTSHNYWWYLRAIFTPSNLSYLSALTRRCRLFTSTRESKEGVMKTTKSSLRLAHTSQNYWWYLLL